MDVVVGGLQVALARWLVEVLLEPAADDIIVGKLEFDGCTIFVAELAEDTGVLQDSPGLVMTAIELADTRKPIIFVFTMN